MTNPQKPSKGLFSWALYDWANSSYFVIIQTFVFAAYFSETIAENVEIGTAQWGNMIGFAGIFIALTAPFFGAIADQAGKRKPWIAFFTIVCVIGSGLLWFAEPDPSSLWLALSLGFISTIAAELVYIFYNAMLPDLVHPSKIGRWSGWGWGMGYAGGLACLLVALYVFIETDGLWLGLNVEEAEPVRATFILTAAWYALFSLPLFLRTPDAPSKNKPINVAVKDGVKQLKSSLKEVKKYKHIVRFLIARMFYNDAIVTIYAMGGIYAVGSFGMEQSEILIFGVGLNITAGLGAALFAWLDDKSGSKFTILVSLVGVAVPIIAVLFTKSSMWFIIWGLFLGLFFGPNQSSSRSFMARIAPPELSTQMFGLLALSGKATAWAGTILFGAFTLLFGTQKAGMVVVLVLLLIGFLIMLTVNEEEAIKSQKE
ncbi:MAG: MFS transporter [Balneola sp.]|nr:MAG: MFS transporter [Balneola sp.]